MKKNEKITTIPRLARLMQEEFLRADKHRDGVDKRLLVVETDLLVVKAGIREIKTDTQFMKERSSELFTKLDEFIALYNKRQNRSSLSLRNK